MEIAHLKKRIEPAFVEVQPCTLSSEEVEIVYLALTRLQEIEKAGQRRDIAEIQALLGWDAALVPNTDYTNREIVSDSANPEQGGS